MKRKVRIGGLEIGGGAPVRVESMLKVGLAEKEKCLAQCERLLSEGCELVRAALPSSELAGALAWLAKRTTLPLMADVHFDPAIAVAAMRTGCPSVRLTPAICRSAGSPKW